MAKRRLVIIGSGIAGLSVAARASEEFETTLVEAELQGGYHSSGRSATIFQKNFETDLFCRMAFAAEPFFLTPPKGYAGVASPLARLIVARPHERDLLDQFVEEWQSRTPWIESVTRAEIADGFPILAEHYQFAVRDKESLRLDIHVLLDGHRRQLRENHGTILNNHRLVGLDYAQSAWQLRFDNNDSIQADVIVNAAGAWADEIASLAGVRRVGLQPKRRTAVLIDPQQECAHWACIYRVASDLYMKPEGNLLMVCPQDEHDSPPTDAQPELIDIAKTVHEFEEATGITVDRPNRSWAGLRSFVPDRNPVIGYADAEQTFFWVGAFGGAGILSSPCYSQIAVRQLLGKSLPAKWNIDPTEFDPYRAYCADT